MLAVADVDPASGRVDAFEVRVREGKECGFDVLMDVRKSLQKAVSFDPHKHWVAPRRSRTLEMCSFLMLEQRNACRKAK
jgi:hypothetical protein